ncbi:MAG TPA: hypothetical protein PK636_00545, partial [bacterium]|nr:hypothetical protein [bacterium]
GGGWVYTETPDSGSIPPGPVAGEANGRAFEVKAVYLQPFFDNWSLYLTTQEMEEPTAIMNEGEYINIDLPRELAAGKTYTHEMGYGGGFFQILSPSSPGETTSWNAENAWILEITSWDVKPFDPDGDIFQAAGTASGRIYVSYQGYGDFKNSGAAGTFENAVVRYMGDPGWTQ